MSESWDDYAEDWDINEDAISYSEKAFETLIKEIKLEGLNILDFGCGTGLLTEKMSQLANKIVALDSSSKMISILNNKKLINVTTISEPLSENTIKENSSLHNKFDLIVASSVFSFLPEYESILVLLKSLLVPDGMLIQWDWLSPKEDSEFGFSEERISSAYSESGFELKSITIPFSHISPKGSTPVLMGMAKNA
jgi:predicted TPR repeat methyltransferase